MTVDSLTPEQEARFPEFVKKWVEIGNSTVTPDFYTPEVIETIKDCIQVMYKSVDAAINRENILISTSPLLSPLVAAGFEHGKKGTPRKKAEGNLPNMDALVNYVNQFSNPKEVIKEADKYTNTRYWGSLDADTRAFIDFFNRVVELPELKRYQEAITAMETLTMLTYDMLINDTFCVVSMKPIHQDLDWSGEYPVASSGEIKWADGTVINY